MVPGGNLGNVSSFGKAFIELKELGLIEKTPRLAVVNAARRYLLSALRAACAGTAGSSTGPSSTAS